jgi:hypothetical protein
MQASFAAIIFCRCEGAAPLAICASPGVSLIGLKRVTHLSRLWRQTVIESP